MYLPLKGFAAMTPTRAFVNFTLVYTLLDDEDGILDQEKLNKWTPVEVDLMGIFREHSADFDIPGDGRKEMQMYRLMKHTDVNLIKQNQAALIARLKR